MLFRSANPAAFLRISAGSLQPGSPADLTIADPQARYTYDRSKAVSKSMNSPYDGFALQGKIVATITGGRLVYQA